MYNLLLRRDPSAEVQSLCRLGWFPNYSFEALFEFDVSNQNGMRLPGDNVTCSETHEYINYDIGCRKIEMHSTQLVTISVEIMHSENLTSDDMEIIQIFQENVCDKSNQMETVEMFMRHNVTGHVCNYSMARGNNLATVFFKFELKLMDPTDIQNSSVSSVTASSIKHIIRSEIGIFNGLGSFWSNNEHSYKWTTRT